MRERHFDLSGGVSSGLRDGWTRRWLAGLRYDSSEFTPTEDLVAGHGAKARPDTRVMPTVVK